MKPITSAMLWVGSSHTQDYKIKLKDSTDIFNMWKIAPFKIMEKLHEKTNRKCPKCKSRFGVILTKNLNKGKSQVLCFNGVCDWKMNIIEWNKKYTRSQFKDTGIFYNTIH